MENRLVYKIGYWSSVSVTIFVVIFGICNILGFFGFETLYYSFVSSFFIAPSFICLIIANFYYAEPEKKIWGLMALSFSIIYAVVVMIVYFMQVTYVNINSATLTEEILSVINFKPGSAFFALDLLGYAFMSLATFFAGLIFDSKQNITKWIKRLFVFHGIFFIPCLVLPTIDFSQAGAGSLSDSINIMGAAGYIFWCLYFSTLSILCAKLYSDELKKNELK